ncbi:hypothetical protein M2317_002203 [Microbacterium sp. ZKA21]|uniref:hypothetical protein n=1 Tax=Microbacterium sp. ZKA21 TaxID=3381694 RepID=UPI003D254B0C
MIVNACIQIDLTQGETATDARRRIRAALEGIPAGYFVQLRVDRRTPVDLASEVGCCFSLIQVTADDAHTAVAWVEAITKAANA